jgi:hypothetical protein
MKKKTLQKLNECIDVLSEGKSNEEIMSDPVIRAIIEAVEELSKHKENERYFRDFIELYLFNQDYKSEN